jgi:hypothetical protein
MVKSENDFTAGPVFSEKKAVKMAYSKKAGCKTDNTIKYL